MNDRPQDEPATRQDRRAKRLKNRRKMAVHGYKIRKQPKKTSGK